MKKRFIAGAMAVLTAGMLFAGCSYEDKGRTPDEFKQNVEGHNFTVEDKSGEASSDSFKTVYLAKNSDSTCTLQYDLMEDESAANKVYEYIYNDLKEAYNKDEEAGNTDNAVVDERTYYYSVDCDQFYCLITKKDNTVLYVVAQPDGKEMAKTIISELAYDKTK